MGIRRIAVVVVVILALGSVAPQAASALAAELHLYVDDSGSMAGYANGDGCYDRMWQEYFDQAVAEAGIRSFTAHYLGSSVRPGPSRADLPRLSDAAKYSEARTALVEFFNNKGFFGDDRARINVLVSDLEPNAVDPVKKCAGNGSVVCLSEALQGVVDRGWDLWLIGFKSRFTGKRYYPRFTPAGVAEEAWNILKNEEVPLYVLVAAREMGAGTDFVERLAAHLRECTSAVRLMRLTHLPVPTVELDLDRPLRAVPQVREGGCGNVKRAGKVALRRTASSTDKLVELRVYEDAWPACISIPVRISAPASVEQIRWTITVSSIAVPPGAQPGFTVGWGSQPVAAGDPTAERVLHVALRPEFLKAARRGVLEIHLGLEAEAVPGEGSPWEDWSYHLAEDGGYQLKTFRTAEVLKDLMGHQVRSQAGSGGLASFVLRFIGD